MIARKANVETVPVDFQKAQLVNAKRCSKIRIFAARLVISGTGSSSGWDRLVRGLTNTAEWRLVIDEVR
jgi:hypothetical protein